MSEESPRRNEFGQPIGPSVGDWTPPPHPPRTPMEGRWCRLEPLDPERHVADLFAASQLDPDGRTWTYMSYGPFATVEEYRAWMEKTCLRDDPLFFAFVDAATGKAVGEGAYLRIEPKAGYLEVGHLYFSPLLQRTPAATEAMYLMMQRAFELGYRRYEWKCDSLNAPSRAAAQRLGFSYEGTFRQATVYKGRSRDTAWFSVIDTEWPPLRAAFKQWLDPSNFDSEGKQRVRLSDLTAPLLKARG
jgi:Acetyltransferases, including N-acetylases of ribosomal proteins